MAEADIEVAFHAVKPVKNHENQQGEFRKMRMEIFFEFNLN